MLIVKLNSMTFWSNLLQIVTYNRQFLPLLILLYVIACRMGWQERMNEKMNANKPSYNTISSRCLVF